jgi:hypothetical protein
MAWMVERARWAWWVDVLDEGLEVEELEELELECMVAAGGVCGFGSVSGAFDGGVAAGYVCPWVSSLCMCVCCGIWLGAWCRVFDC